MKKKKDRPAAAELFDSLNAGIVAQQEELRASEARLFQLAAQSGMVAWEVDAQGLFTYVSPVAETVLGYRPEELTGKRYFYELHPEAGREAFKKAAFEVFARMKPFQNLVNPVQAKDGRQVWVSTNGLPLLDSDGTLRGYQGSDTDITERRQAEEQVRNLLEESDRIRRTLAGLLEDDARAKAELKRLATAIAQAAEIIVITDRHGAIQYVNPAFETVTGYARAEVVGKNPHILKSGQQDAAFYRDLWQALVDGRVWRGRFVNRKKSGVLYTEEATISPVRDEAGVIASYVAVKRDITEELILEAQLSQAQKMESVGRLAGGVAHDFNNILQAILGNAQMAADQPGLSAALRHELSEIQAAAHRAAALTRQLLAFARKQVISPRTISLNETVESTLKMLTRLIGENIELDWKPGAALWPVKMDPSQIDQLLVNLCVNARDAISGVGAVYIATENVCVGELQAARHEGFVPGDYVLLTVSDTGCGMDKETLASIFEPFFTTKAVGKGAGLGLATVYGIARQNRGHVGVYSEPGKGTTFRIHLPRHRVTEAEQLEQSSERPLACGTETVLLVEDDLATLSVVDRAMRGLGYTVFAADTPEAALRMAHEHAGQIRLLVTDVIMPDMNGRELADLLKQRHPGLACLFMSGFTADVLSRRGVLVEGVQFISKPFVLAELAAKMRDALDGR